MFPAQTITAWKLFLPYLTLSYCYTERHREMKTAGEINVYSPFVKIFWKSCHCVLTSSGSLGCWREPASPCQGSKCCPGFWCPCNQNQTQPSASSPTPGSPPTRWPSAGCHCLCGDHSLSERTERAWCETAKSGSTHFRFLFTSAKVSYFFLHLQHVYSKVRQVFWYVRIQHSFLLLKRVDIWNQKLDEFLWLAWLADLLYTSEFSIQVTDLLHPGWCCPVWLPGGSWSLCNVPERGRSHRCHQRTTSHRVPLRPSGSATGFLSSRTSDTSSHWQQTNTHSYYSCVGDFESCSDVTNKQDTTGQ